MQKCKHCGVEIKHFHGPLWHDNEKIFPQYCQSKYDENGN